jgi:2-succinyl-5-enolpyruvyl-6-hydroxy-3-cyclohexene-1-carboxylate synthase
VLRLGAPWASKILGQWLASLDRAEHVLVDPHRAWADPDRLATTVVAADPTLVCESLLETGIEPAPVEWLSEWREAERAAQSRFDQVLAEHLEVTEPGIARALYGALPDGSTLFVSSSMPVRDVEGFGAPRDGLRVLANRGANGIDGVVSSALGVAAAAGGPAAALVGDLAFLHDVNGLLIPPGTAAGVDCTTVVVDNGGGGIFSFLPQRETLPEARFERLFGTPQPVDIAAVAAAYGAPVTAIEKAADLAPALAESTAAGGMRVLHARTDRDANVALHHQLWST